MVDPGQVYDTIQLTVTTGGFTDAQTRINNLIEQLGKLGGMVTPIRIDTSQITSAITQLQGLSRGVVPPAAPTGRAGFVPPGIAGAKARQERYRAIDRRYAKIQREQIQREWAGPTQRTPHAEMWAARGGGPVGYEKNVMAGKVGVETMAGTETPKATADVAKLNKEMGKTVTAASNVGKAAPKATRAIKNVGKATKNASEKASAYTLTWKNMSMVMGKVAFWMVATGAIYGTIRAFKSMVDVIIDVDHAMAGILKVYRGAKEDILPLRNSLIELSIQLGGNTTQVMEAATRWAKLGYTGQQISGLMKTSMLAMNIAELSAEDSTRYLTAAMIQFNIKADHSIDVLDSWNELSNRTAATTRDLGEVVARAGKTFEMMGDDIHYVNAVGATLVETMARSGEEVGTAMRTIGAYLYRPKTIEKVQEIGGVEIQERDAQGQLTGGLRSQSEILGELAAKWDTLSEQQQVSLAQAIAGARRYQYFINIMDNYDKILDNLVTSLEGTGSATRENEIYMNTLQKQIDQLKARFQGLAVQAGDTGLAGGLKTLIQWLSKLIDFLDKLHFGGLAVAAVLLLLVKKLSLFAKMVQTAGLQLWLMSKRTHMAGRTLGRFGNVLSTASRAVGVLQAAIIAGTIAYEAYKHAINEANKALNELAASQTEATTAASENARTTENQAQRMSAYYKQMRQAQAQYKTAETEEERVKAQREYLRWQQKYWTTVKEMGIDGAESIAEANEAASKKTVAAKEVEIKAIEEDKARIDGLIDTIDRGLPVYEEWGNVSMRMGEMVGKKQEVPKALADLQDLLEQAKEGTGTMGDLGISFQGGEVSAENLREALVRTGTDLDNQLTDKAMAAAESTENLGGTVGGTGDKIDGLGDLLAVIQERLARTEEPINKVNHALEMNRAGYELLETQLGDNVDRSDEWLATASKEYDMLGNLRTAYEARRDVLKSVLEILGLQGPALVENEEDERKLAAAIRNINGELRDNEEQWKRVNNTSVEHGEHIDSILADYDKLNRTLERGREGISRVLPFKTDEKYFRDMRYTMEDVNDRVDALNRADAKRKFAHFEINELSNLYLMNADEIYALLSKHGIALEDQKLIIDDINGAVEVSIDYAEELNREYRELAGTFQNIVDEGLFGIIMGEQTAIDLAKELGREWADIALKTVTQPATEMFGKGMGGAAFFMKHGKLPPAMGGGIADVKLKDGRVPVYDEALAGVVAAAAGGPGVVPAGMGPVAGAQGAGQPGAGGPGALGTIMPIAGGMMAGGLMGAGGGGAGAGFGAMMGGIGGAVSLIPGWGQIAGAGISLLGLLGNLFGGGKHEEEDPYANQQATGMGERSVSIGSAGTVNNHVYITMYYESSLEKVDAERLFDAVEEVGAQRGYQVTGNPTPATV